MELKLAKIRDFKTVECTVSEKEYAGINHRDLRFLVCSTNRETLCKIEETWETYGYRHFLLSVGEEFTNRALKEDQYLLCISGRKISRLLLKKIEVVDLYAQLVENESFFPIVEGDKTTFRVFSPFAKQVSVKLCPDPDGESDIVDMNETEGGKWEKTVEGDLHQTPYRYILRFDSKVVETIDPFSLSLTQNSEYSVIIDLNRLKETEIKPLSKDYQNPCDAVLYECHIRDLTADPETAFPKRNAYTAFSQQGITKNGLSAGIDHIKELGATHVHLLPVQDFESVAETHPADYNWGYDPKCYTVPEGSYSYDPKNPGSRVKEFREMVNQLHDSDLGVIIDVVYNHTYEKEGSIFDAILPDYAYRWADDGNLSNGSGCGNEIATERLFVRKYIIDSLLRWMDWYGVDGFRFDLMGLMDTDTMLAIETKLREKKADVILYGEPWTAGMTTLPDNKRSLKGFQKGHRIAVFNDELRNALKGFPDDNSTGFVSGNIDTTWSIIGSMLGSVGYEKGLTGFTHHPGESINYNSCHDNLTLYDKLKKSLPKKDQLNLCEVNKLSAFIVLLSQGIPFLHAGEEIGRTKYGNHNSYNAGDIYNAIRWSRKSKFKELFDYYKNLIRLRQEHPLFKIQKREELFERINLIHLLKGAFAYTINGRGIDDWNCVLVGINMTDEDLWIKLPAGEWTILVTKYHAGISPLGIAENEMLLQEKCWYLLKKE